MSDFDLQPLPSLLSEYLPQGRSALLPALHAAQKHYGYLPEPVAAEIGRLLSVPLADVYGVIDFYSMFYRQPTGEKMVRVCTDPACALAGGEALLNNLCSHLGVQLDEPSADGSVMVERAPCLGLCEHAPAVLVNERAVSAAAAPTFDELLSEDSPPPGPVLGGDLHILTENCANGMPTSLHKYVAGGGYTGLKKALKLTPGAVIAEVKASGLVGRGGAAFPTGIKWEGAASAKGSPKYVVCNADESEPGTFKDRVLMEGDPQRVLEGMIIAAYAIGAHLGYIFVRGEYPAAFQIMSDAAEQARQAGYLGKNILESGFDFDVELRLGAGAYICGEETALFEAIEGRRGFPRVKPPFPTTHGLFGKPTAVNNVETLSNVPYLFKHGATAYRQIGTENSPGPKLFCVSGDVARPGLYEVPFGITLRHLVFDLAGGMRNGNGLQTILFGGAAGAFATHEQLDVRMSFEDLRAAGLPLGSGVVMVFDDSRDLRDVLVRLGRFFAHEFVRQVLPVPARHAAPA